MKELLQSFFKTTEERIKNPFIGAFMTSWILFNWKPITLLLFSSRTIESKIDYVEKNFSNIWLIFILPFASAFFYVLVLPYLNLLFEELLKYSLLKRNNLHINKQKQNIENQKQLAIEEIKLEEAKTEFRERKTHNQLVEDLQKKNKEYEELIDNEKIKNWTTIEDLKNEIIKRDEMSSLELRNFERRNSDTRAETIELTERLYDRDRHIQELTSRLNNENLKNDEIDKILQFEKGKNSDLVENLKTEIVRREERSSLQIKSLELQKNTLSTEIDELKKKIYSNDNYIKVLNSTLNSKNFKNDFLENIIKFDNNLEIIERVDDNELKYIDATSRRVVPQKEIDELMNRYGYTRSFSK